MATLLYAKDKQKTGQQVSACAYFYFWVCKHTTIHWESELLKKNGSIAWYHGKVFLYWWQFLQDLTLTKKLVTDCRKRQTSWSGNRMHGEACTNLPTHCNCLLTTTFFTLYLIDFTSLPGKPQVLPQRPANLPPPGVHLKARAVYAKRLHASWKPWDRSAANNGYRNGKLCSSGWWVALSKGATTCL